MPPKNIILAGFGPHARHIYYPLLEKYADQYDIRGFGRPAQPFLLYISPTG